MGKQVDIISFMFQLRPDDMYIKPWQLSPYLSPPRPFTTQQYLPILETALQARHQQKNASLIFYRRYPIRRQRHPPSAIPIRPSCKLRLCHKWAGNIYHGYVPNSPHNFPHYPLHFPTTKHEHSAHQLPYLHSPQNPALRINSVSLLQPRRTPTSPLRPFSYPNKRPPHQAFPPVAPAWTHHGLGKTGNRPTGTIAEWARFPKVMLNMTMDTGREGAFRGSRALVIRRHRTGMGVVIIHQVFIHQHHPRRIRQPRYRIMTRALQVLQHQ